MQDSYLSHHTRNPGRFLPHLRLPKHRPIQMIREPTQQSLMLEINQIDSSLNSKNYRYHQGYLFSGVVEGRLVGDLYAEMGRKQVGVIQEGFWWKDGGRSARGQIGRFQVKGDGVDGVKDVKGVKVKNSGDKGCSNDIGKYMKIMQCNNSRWSPFKKTETSHPESSNKSSTSQSHEGKKTTHRQLLKNSITTSIYDSANSINIKSILLSSPSLNHSHQISTTNTAKIQQRMGNIGSDSKIRQGKQRSDKKKVVLTQIHDEIECPEESRDVVSMEEIKNVLEKEKDHLVVLWLPPSTYPQFNGMFTYASTRKLSVCRLKKYYLFRKSTSKRLFNSIIQQLSVRENRHIQGIEISILKTDFINLFQALGWKMKSQEGIDRVRIQYNKQIN